MSNMRRRFASLLAFDFTGFDGRDALRGAVIAIVVTAIPVLAGDSKAAIPLSIGAVFTAISEAGQPFGKRWRTMLGTTAALMVAAFVGASLSETTWLAIAVTGPVAFACGLIGAVGKRAAVGGLLALVIFSIYVGIPVSMDDASSTALLIGLGGVIQTFAAVSVGLVRGQHWKQSAETADSLPLRERLRNEVFLSHATRLAIAMVIATAISENFSIPHPYWLPMSVAWMSKPDFTGTVDRVMHRLVGTIIGLVATALLVYAFTPNDIGFLVVSVSGAAIAIAFIWSNYAFAVTGVSIWVIALFGMVGDPVVSTVEIRLLATVAAAVIVIVAIWLVPGFHPRDHRQTQSRADDHGSG